MWDPKAEGKKGREGDLWRRLSEILKRVIWTNSIAESKSILLGLDTPLPQSPEASEENRQAETTGV